VSGFVCSLPTIELAVADVADDDDVNGNAEGDDSMVVNENEG
jgi:hypothetical protein